MMDDAAVKHDVRRQADRLSADLRRSLTDLHGQGDWQRLADVLQAAASAAESLKMAAEHYVREENHEQP